jgi:hypothetical protein
MGEPCDYRYLDPLVILLDFHPATELNDAKRLLVRIVSMLSKMCR